MVDGMQELVNVLQSDTTEPSKTYHAEVSSIDNEGTVWVYLEGSTMETPTTMSSSEVAVGDNVNVEWRNNKLYIAGNVSNPSAGSIRVTAVEQAAQIANQAASNAVADAGIARSAAEQAQSAVAEIEGEISTLDTNVSNLSGRVTTLQGRVTSAEEDVAETIHALGVAESVIDTINWITEHGAMVSQAGQTFDANNVYFEADPNGIYVVGSTHYSIVESPVASDIGSYYLLSTDGSITNYVESHIALTSSGLVVTKDNTKWYVLIKNDGIDIVDNTEGLHKVVAQYKSTITLGVPNRPHVDITPTSQAFTMRNGVRLFELNADPSFDPIQRSMQVEATGQTAYEVGWIPTGSLTVKVDGVVMTEGVDYTLNQATIVFTTAPPIGSTVYWSGFMFVNGVSYTLGVRGYATTYDKGLFSVAEGELCVADAGASHAEGRKSMALGDSAHAEGNSTTASGHYSHSQNNVTTAQRKSQTAIGEFNLVDTTGATANDRGEYVLIIGNGTGYTARSNALAVTWDGNAHIDLAGYQTTDDIDKDIYDALVSLGWDSEVTE